RLTRMSRPRNCSGRPRRRIAHHSSAKPSRNSGVIAVSSSCFQSASGPSSACTCVIQSIMPGPPGIPMAALFRQAGPRGLTRPDKFLTLPAMAGTGASAEVRGMVPSAYVRLLYEYLERQGLDPRRLLREPPPQAADRGGGRYPVARWRALLERAAAALDDPLLGLKLGRSITPAHLGVIGYVLLACGNLGAALQRLEQYQRLVYDVNPMRTQAEGTAVVLEWGVEQ